MDPPGHTVFLYLRELNRAELQKQAKLYGIKANQKSEALRQQLQEVLVARDNVKSPSPSVTVVEEEAEEVEIDANGIVVAKEGEKEEKDVEQPSNTSVDEAEEEKEEKDQDQEVAKQTTIAAEEKPEESTTVNEMGSKHEESAWMEGEDDDEEEEEKEEEEVQEEEEAVQESANVNKDETENDESSTAAPPYVVIVDLDSDEMVDLADESIVSPTTAAKEMFRSKIPNGPSSSRNVLGERSTNSGNYTSKLGKPTRQFQPMGNVAKIIRTKNSPMRRPAAASKIPRKPVLQTQTHPRPKSMPLSRRNELQLQKFVERQNRGRKNRAEQLKRVEFANLVRSPGKA